MGRIARRLVLALAVAAGACARPAGIERVHPLRGHVEGGSPLRIEGAGFSGHGALVVYVGVEHARGVVVWGDGLVTALAPPAEAPGPATVRLRFDDGTTYEAPEPFVYGAGPRILDLTRR